MMGNQIFILPWLSWCHLQSDVALVKGKSICCHAGCPRFDLGARMTITRCHVQGRSSGVRLWASNSK